MGERTAGTTTMASTAKIQVSTVDDAPASVLIEISGTDAGGEPAFVAAAFDALHLGDLLFPALFERALADLVETVRARAMHFIDKPITGDALRAVHDGDFCAPDFVSVMNGAKAMRQAEREVVHHLCFSIMEQASFLRAAQPPEPAPAKSEPGSPPRDDGALLADRVSNSIGTAGGADTPMPEHSPEPDEATSA